MMNLAGWSDAPSDVLLCILLHLGLEDRLQTSQVCRQWRSILCTSQAQVVPTASSLIGELILDMNETVRRLGEEQDPDKEGVYLCRWLAQRALAISTLHVFAVNSAAPLLASLVDSLQHEVASGSLCISMHLAGGPQDALFSQCFQGSSFLTNLSHHLTGLQICLQAQSVSRLYFAEVCRLTRLTFLRYEVVDKWSSDAVITPAITALRSLERLELVKHFTSNRLPGVPAEWWEKTLPPELSCLPHLTSITFRSYQIIMPAAACVPNLQFLRLDFSRVTLPASLPPMTALRELHIGHERGDLGSSIFHGFSSMCNLTRLDLISYMEEDGYELLESMQHLTNLKYLRGVTLDLQTSYPSLENLSMQWPGEQEVDATKLSCVSGLTYLSLHVDPPELGDGWGGLCEVLPRLQTLELDCWPSGWSDRSHFQLQALQALTSHTNLALKSVKF